MPELPEVETVVNDLLASGIVGRTITGARVFWPRSVAMPSAEAFCQALPGRAIERVWRRAKYLIMDLSGGEHLLAHLRMSGRIHLVATDEPRAKHEHIVIDLDDGRQLRLHDTRKFGRMYLVRELDAVLGHLGPEPLSGDFTADILLARLHEHDRQMKPLLLDQAFLAGLGNIYTDEALWEAQIHPCRRSSSISEEEARRLHRAIQSVLRRGIENAGTSLGNGKANFYSVKKRQGRNAQALNVFRRTDLPCPRCATRIERIIVGQRSTHLCPACQPFPPLYGREK